MLFVSLVGWWYGAGWMGQVRLVRGWVARIADFFSIGLLVRTWFKPFRQIDADRARKGSLDVIIRGAFDQLFSRLIGALARTVLILVGISSIAISSVIGILRLALWPLVPPLPLVALLPVMTGWLPWL